MSMTRGKIRERAGQASVGRGRNSGKHEGAGGGMRMRMRRRRRRRRGMAGLAWKIETGSIVTALMPLFLPITPLRPLRAHNDTLNGRPEGNGAVSSRDPCLRLLPFSKYYNEEMRVNAIVSSLSLSFSLSLNRSLRTSLSPSRLYFRVFKMRHTSRLVSRGGVRR